MSKSQRKRSNVFVTMSLVTLIFGWAFGGYWIMQPKTGFINASDIAWIIFIPATWLLSAILALIAGLRDEFSWRLPAAVLPVAALVAWWASPFA